MYTVAIHFKNETKLLFYAESFDIEIEDPPNQGRLLKYTYKDANGEDAPLWLVPDEVAAIVVAPVASDGGMSIVAN
jgi:hypothetical protein